MKHVRIVGLALLALFALGVVVASSASAVERLLPIGQTFSFLSKKATFETTGKEKIVCGDAKGEGKGVVGKEGEKEPDTHGSVTIDFLACEVNGFPIFSLGEKEPKEVKEALILWVALYLICLINPTTLLFGIFIQLDNVFHNHIKALSVLINLTGSIIGDILGNGLAKLFIVHFIGKEGNQEITECKDEAGNVKRAELKSEADPAAALTESVNIEAGAALIQFPVNVEFMDQ